MAIKINGTTVIDDSRNGNLAAITATGNITGSYIFGNGSQLTGIDATSIQNGTSNVKVLSSGGNASVGIGGTSNVMVWATTGAYVTGVMSASGNITGSYIFGNGSQLTGIDATSIQNGTSNVKVTSSGGNVSVGVGGTPNVAVWATTGEYVTGVVSASGNVTGANVNATTNITVGGLILNGNTITSTGSTLTLDPNGTGGVDGQVTIAGNLQVTGNVTYIDSNVVTTNDLVINMANNAASAAAANGAGIGVGPAGSEYAKWLYNNTQNNWTTALGISATGNITGGNILTSGVLLNSAVSTSGNVTGANFLTGGLISATGNITGGNLSVGVGTVTFNNVVNGGASATGNIGSTALPFNTVFAKATSAQYADLAEMYEADAIIEPGTVVEFGGSKEVTQCNGEASKRIAGVVSTNPSYIMNAGLAGENVTAVALTGRVPTKVTGLIRKGDMLVSAGGGRARAEADPAVGTVVGKALADFDGADGVIEVVVGRL